MRNLCENVSTSNSRLYCWMARCGCASGCARGCVRRRSVPAASCLGARVLESRTDSYAYNARSELISASKSGGSQFIATDPEYAYAYDDIGNRISSLDLGTNRTYVANSLNQYTSISGSAGGSPAQTENFTPSFDLDGNQTLIRTSTGDWSVTYNAENRPVLWSCGTTNIVMSFDRMGRRVEYLESEREVHKQATAIETIKRNNRR